jgi:predicted dehydrogenase
MATNTTRRDFLKAGAATGLGVGLGGVWLSGCADLPRLSMFPPPGLFTARPVDPVRVGYVGIGNQGSSHVRNLLRIEGAQITALCDIVPEKVERAQKRVEEAGQPKPAAYTRGPTDFVRMCENEQLDLVYTATPWDWHVPVCVAAMKNGKHAATEVPAAVTLEECWRLVETAEKTRRYCVMMENCCYDRAEMLILNMVSKGLFGELLHAEGGYLHDLRDLKLSDTFYEGSWRVKHSIKRNGDLYPTHGLGPLAQCMEVNRGDAFDYLVSMSCNSRGLNLYAAEKFGPADLRVTQKYALGDIVSTLIRTEKGRTILLQHDTNSPRPYSRNILVQGTKGIVRKYPEEKIHIEGRTPAHSWEELSNYMEEFEHPIWKKLREDAAGAGHGGMDFIEDYRLIQALREGIEPDMDVYDAAALSAVSALTERSIANKSSPVNFPDFTRGMWKKARRLQVMSGMEVSSCV